MQAGSYMSIASGSLEDGRLCVDWACAAYQTRHIFAAYQTRHICAAYQTRHIFAAYQNLHIFASCVYSHLCEYTQFGRSAVDLR